MISLASVDYGNTFSGLINKLIIRNFSGLKFLVQLIFSCLIAAV